MISYLPAFVTVGIIQSIRRPARAALATQTAIEANRVAALEGEEPDNFPRPSNVKFLVYTSGNASADTRAPSPDSTH
jgi:hypothetical protein